MEYFLKAQQKTIAMITPEHVLTLCSKVQKLVWTKSKLSMQSQQSFSSAFERNLLIQEMSNFSPVELRGMTKELLFGLMNGRKIQEFLALAWRRGIQIMQDPLLSTILACLPIVYYQGLKRKARIFIEDSANLIGVIDPTGTLESDQVFIKIKKTNFGSKKSHDEASIVKEILEHQKMKFNKNSSEVILDASESTAKYSKFCSSDFEIFEDDFTLKSFLEALFEDPEEEKE